MPFLKGFNQPISQFLYQRQSLNKKYLQVDYQGDFLSDIEIGYERETPKNNALDIRHFQNKFRASPR